MKIKLKDKQRFNELIIKRGLSKNKLAKISNLSQPHILQVSQGVRYPSPSSAQKILEALDLEFDDVFIIEHEQKEVSVK